MDSGNDSEAGGGGGAGEVGCHIPVWISVWETLVQLREEDTSGVARGLGSGTTGLQGHHTILFLLLQPWLDSCVNRCQHRFLFPWGGGGSPNKLRHSFTSTAGPAGAVGEELHMAPGLVGAADPG